MSKAESRRVRSVSQTYHKRVSVGGTPNWRRQWGSGRFFVIVWRVSCFDTIGSHFARVSSHLKELDF